VIRVLAADDHEIVRVGIADLIETQSDMQLVAEASDGREAVAQFRNHHPDVTLMDLQMPNMSGIDAINVIRDEFPEARIIVLTTYAGDAQVKRALQAGAQGYLLKGFVAKRTAGHDPCCT
jgi:DNA-binding NarL/FixJ family response regulator